MKPTENVEKPTENVDFAKVRLTNGCEAILSLKEIKSIQPTENDYGIHCGLTFLHVKRETAEKLMNLLEYIDLT
jgi:hypothetical protein